MEARAAGFRRSILNEFALHSPTAVAAFRPAVPARPDLVTACLRPSPAPTHNSPMRDNPAELTRPSGSNRSLCRALAMIAMAGIAVTVATACADLKGKTIAVNI